MAFTFEELSTWWPGKSYPNGNATLLISQEDGRTCFARGTINQFNAGTSSFSGQYEQLFNDRTRLLNYAPPSIRQGTYEQNFDENNGVDLANFDFVKISTNNYQLRLILLRWGNVQVTVNLRKASQAKLYTGWGQTIGHGSGLALYVLSLNNAIETPG